MILEIDEGQKEALKKLEQVWMVNMIMVGGKYLPQVIQE